MKILFDRVNPLAPNTLSNGRPGLPDSGDLSLDIYDAFGRLIVSGVHDPLVNEAGVVVSPEGNNRAAVFGATNDPTVPQFNRIFIRVKGVGQQPTLSINVYDFDDLTSTTRGVANVDVFGPQVTNVTITDNPATAVNEAAFRLFDAKPSRARRRWPRA